MAIAAKEEPPEAAPTASAPASRTLLWVPIGAAVVLLALIVVVLVATQGLDRILGGESAPGLAAPAAPPAGSPGGSPAAPGLRMLLDERFVTNERGWPNNPQRFSWLADGEYRLFARQPGQFVAVGAPANAVPAPLKDVIVSATFRKVGGPPGGGYGIVLRDQGPGTRDGASQQGAFYVLEVGDRGEYGIWRRDGDRWVDLIPWSQSPAVKPGGEANQLTATALGDRLSLAVNGTTVATVTDPTLAQGSVGVFVGGDLNEVLLERLLVAAPQ